MLAVIQLNAMFPFGEAVNVLLKWFQFRAVLLDIWAYVDVSWKHLVVTWSQAF